MGFLDSLGYMMLDNDKMHFNPSDAQDHTDSEKWLVTLSSPLSVFNGGFLNTIETGQNKKTISDILNDMWGISDRKSFEEVAEWLTKEGHRRQYQLIFQAIKKVQLIHENRHFLMKIADMFAPIMLAIETRKVIDLAALSQQTGYTQSELRSKIPNFSTSTNWYNRLISTFRKKSKCLPEQINGLVAWDAVRLVSITRWAIELGYIERSEFEHYAGQLRHEVKHTYKSWDEVSAAYIISGLIWKHSEGREENMVRTNLMLVKESKSPYKTIMF